MHFLFNDSIHPFYYDMDGNNYIKKETQYEKNIYH